MTWTRIILLTVLLCACAAQSSYTLNDADIDMQGSYGDETGRRLQQGSGINVQNSTVPFPDVQCQPKYVQKCICSGTNHANSCVNEAFKCTCTNCCQDSGLFSKYSNFLFSSLDHQACNTLDSVLPTDGVTDCTFPLAVPATNTFRYQGITPLG